MDIRDQKKINKVHITFKVVRESWIEVRILSRIPWRNTFHTL